MSADDTSVSGYSGGITIKVARKQINQCRQRCPLTVLVHTGSYWIGRKSYSPVFIHSYSSAIISYAIESGSQPLHLYALGIYSENIGKSGLTCPHKRIIGYDTFVIAYSPTAIARNTKNHSGDFIIIVE